MTVAPCFSVVTKQFSFIPEFDEEFLSLFPHRNAYLWAEHPDPGDRPEWNTENRHPLSDRLILQGAYLYGIRFGKTTNYLLADVDTKSAYHPAHDPFAIGQILETLEPLGIHRYVAVSSSYSGGLHLYFPFSMGIASWAIAQAAALLLEHRGFKLSRGQLELFPNPRRSNTCEYNGHRLPLQQGSYLIDDDWQSRFSSRDRFVAEWRLAQSGNSVSEAKVQQVFKQHRRKAYRKMGNTAQKFLNDLNADIEPGWTGYGQTNYLLGRIAIREYVFNHALYGGAPLQGTALAAQIADIAESLPGFHRWCRHQADLTDRCLEWARAIEASDYYPYGGDQVLEIAAAQTTPTPNQERAQTARERIQNSVSDLIQKGTFPSTIRGRIFALKAYGISSATLYKNLDLWHVENDLKPSDSRVIQAIEAKSTDPQSLKPSDSRVIQAIDPISFYTADLTPSQEGSDLRTDQRAVGGSGGFSTAPAAAPSPPTPHSPPPTSSPPTSTPLQGPAIIRHVINQILVEKARKRATPDPTPPPDEQWFEQLHLKGVQPC